MYDEDGNYIGEYRLGDDDFAAALMQGRPGAGYYGPGEQAYGPEPSYDQGEQGTYVAPPPVRRIDPGDFSANNAAQIAQPQARYVPPGGDTWAGGAAYEPMRVMSVTGAPGVGGRGVSSYQHPDYVAEQRLAQSVTFGTSDLQRMNDLQRQVEVINTGFARGEFTPQSRAEALGQLQPELTSLQQRRTIAQMSQEQLQRSTQEANLARSTAIMSQNENFAVGNTTPPRFWTDPESGQRFFLGRAGAGWTPVREQQERPAMTEPQRLSAINTITNRINNQVTQALRNQNDPSFPFPDWFREPDIVQQQGGTGINPIRAQSLRQQAAAEIRRQIEEEGLARPNGQRNSPSQATAQPRPASEAPQASRAQPITPEQMTAFEAARAQRLAEATRPLTAEETRAGVGALAQQIGQMSQRDPKIAEAVGPLSTLLSQREPDLSQVLALANDIPPDVRRQIQIPEPMLRALQAARLQGPRGAIPGLRPTPVAQMRSDQGGSALGAVSNATPGASLGRGTGLGRTAEQQGVAPQLVAGRDTEVPFLDNAEVRRRQAALNPPMVLDTTPQGVTAAARRATQVYNEWLDQEGINRLAAITPGSVTWLIGEMTDHLRDASEAGRLSPLQSQRYREQYEALTRRNPHLAAMFPRPESNANSR